MPDMNEPWRLWDDHDGCVEYFVKLGVSREEAEEQCRQFSEFGGLAKGENLDPMHS